GQASGAPGSGRDGVAPGSASGAKPLPSFFRVGNLTFWSRGRGRRERPSGKGRPAMPDSGAFSSRRVLIHYPARIALAYRRVCQQGKPGDRTDRLFGVLEATLKYLVFLGVSDLLRCRAGSGAPAAELLGNPAFDFMSRPTKMLLGKWAAALRETARALAREKD